MSSKTGQAKRTRPQKHQNQSQWKANKFKTDPTTKLLENIVITNCCPKCTGVIEWKVKYGKYKPLTQPAKCVKCSQRRVKSAYQIICVSCVEETGVCAKCGQKAEVVNNTIPTAAEQARLDAEFQNDLKALPERKRRSFLRYQRRQETLVTKPRKVPEDEEEGEEQDEELVEEGPPKTLLQVKQEIREKLKVLTEKYAKDDDFFFDDDFGSDDDDEDFDQEAIENLKV